MLFGISLYWRKTEEKNGVTDGARTHDNQNHNLALYQLNYGHHKIWILFISIIWVLVNKNIKLYPFDGDNSKH